MEISSQMTSLILATVLTLGAYFFRLEVKSLIQKGVDESEKKAESRRKEQDKRVELVENENRILRQELGAMATAQTYMNSNIDKLELSMEKLETKMDGLMTSQVETKTIMHQILDNVRGNR